MESSRGADGTEDWRAELGDTIRIPALDDGDETGEARGIHGNKTQKGQFKISRRRKNTTPVRSVAPLPEENEVDTDIIAADKKAKRKIGPEKRSDEEEARGRKILEAMEKSGFVRLSLTPEQCRSDIAKAKQTLKKMTVYDSDTVTDSSDDE